MPNVINVAINVPFSIALVTNAVPVSYSVLPKYAPKTVETAIDCLPQVVGDQLFWTVKSLEPMPFEVLVQDIVNRTASWTPELHFCPCLNGGSCSSANRSLGDGLHAADCTCASGYSGDYCQLKVCTQEAPCHVLVSCTSATRDSRIVVCEPCPSNMESTTNYANMTAFCSCPADYEADAVAPLTCSSKIEKTLAILKLTLVLVGVVGGMVLIGVVLFKIVQSSRQRYLKKFRAISLSQSETDGFSYKSNQHCSSTNQGAITHAVYK